MLVLVVGFGAAAVGAAFLACLLRPRSVVSFVLETYLFVWAELLVVCSVLSIGSWLERWSLLAGLFAVSGAAAILWSFVGKPRPPSLVAAARRARLAAADPLVAVLLVVGGLALTYTLVVTLSTAPNDGDPLVYEITRAAFWHQQQGIGNLGAGYQPSLDFWPPVAETGVLSVLTLSGSDQFVGLSQWFAVPMLALATYGVARRIGLKPAAALWAGALVPTLPVVLAQSWSAFTDVVFSVFAVSAVYFGIGELGLELVPFSLAVGLAVGTKYLGPIFAPLFAVILGVAQPPRRWAQLAGAALVGAAVAGTWYVRTQIENGDPAGNNGVGLQSHDVASVVTTFQRMSVEVLDLSGASHRGVWVYSGAALVLVAVALVLALRRDGRTTRSLLLAAGLVAVLPFVVRRIADVWAAIGVDIGRGLGRADLVDQLRGWNAPTAADGAFSWFGPVGALLAVAALPIAIVELRRRLVTRTAIVLAAAPLAAIASIALVVSYQRYQGRYFISAFALCAATCGGYALTRRWFGTLVVAAAAVSAGLTLVNAMGKPTGITLLGESPSDSVWSMARWEQQGILRSTPAERDEVQSMRFVEEHVPADARLGIALVGNSFAEPYFGEHLDRRLTIVDGGDVLPGDVEWVVVSPGRTLAGCPEAWTRVRHGPYGWSVWQRVAADACATPAPLPT